MTLNRAYSLLTVKSVQEDKRIIEGIATTPEPDRMADVVETDGIEFSLPLPLLRGHRSDQPIGKVIEAKVSKAGIKIKAQLADAGIAGWIDETWALIKAGLMSGLSIGFRSIEDAYNRDTGGFHFLRTEWMELSVVVIPANASATILSVKSIDTAVLAALGTERSNVVRLDSSQLPGASGKAKEQKSMKTITEQITAFEAKRSAHDARMGEIMSKAEADGMRTLDAEETSEYDGLGAEVKAIDEHLVRLHAREKQLIATAKPVNPDAGKDESHEPRHIVSVKSNQPKGIGMARMAIAVASGMLSYQNPIEIAKRRWPDSPEVALAIKAVVEAGDTTTSGWASQLVPAAQQLNEDFLELLRPETIIGKLPLNQVPFNVSVPIETASGTARWVGEGAPKPVTKLTLSNVTLTWAKAAAIVAITEELAKFSRPDAEMVVRNSMVKTLVRFFDSHFVSSTAAVSGVSPAGILNGISATSTTGTTAAAFRTDMTTLLNKLTVNNVALSGIWLLMSSTQAVNLSLMVTDLGVPLFPSIDRAGGSILGFPVVISEAVGTKIIAINASEILLASDPGVSVATSREATIEMDDEPAGGETSPVTAISTMKSAFQNNLIFIKVEQYITWKRGRDSAVEYLNAVAYRS